jgi:hypothetical protein
MIIRQGSNSFSIVANQSQFQQPLDQKINNPATQKTESQNISGATNVTGVGEVLIANTLEEQQLEKEIGVLKKEIIDQLKSAKSLVSPEAVNSFIQEFPNNDQALAQNILKLAFPFSNNAGLSLITEMVVGIRDPISNNKLQIVETEPLKHNSVASVLYYLIANKSSGHYVDSSAKDIRISRGEIKQYFANSTDQQMNSDSALILNQDLLNKFKKNPNLLKQVIESEAKLIIFEGLTEFSNPYSFSFDTIKEETRNLLKEIKEKFSNSSSLKPEDLLRIISEIRTKALTDQLNLIVDSSENYRIANENILTISLPQVSRKQLVSEKISAYDNFSKERININEEDLEQELIHLQAIISKVLKDSDFKVDDPLMNKSEIKDFLKIYKDLLVTVNQRDLSETLFNTFQQVLGNLPEGHSRENILFFVPKDASKQYRSLSLLNLILKEQYGFQDEQFVTVEELQENYTSEDLKDKTFVILDDFAGSGNGIFYFAQELLVGRKLPKNEQDEYRDKMKDQKNLILVNLFATNYARQNISSQSALPDSTIYIQGDKSVESIYENETFIQNRFNNPGKYDLQFGSHGFTKGKPGDGNGVAIVFFYMGPNNSVQAFANLNTLFTSTGRASIKNLNTDPESISEEVRAREFAMKQAIAEKIRKAGYLLLTAKIRDEMKKIPPPEPQEKIKAS